jgi:luciferase family oxidoreductase group 1
VRAIPGEGLDIPIWILGSSTDSAQLAAALGLPYAFASHFAPGQFFAAIDLYRRLFRPSKYLAKPYVMACVNVITADTDAEAHLLATSLYQMFLGIVTGIREPLQPPVENMEEIWTEDQKAALNQMLSLSFIGSGKTVKKDLAEFITQTNINEIMIISNIYDQQAKIYSYNLFSKIMKNTL